MFFESAFTGKNQWWRYLVMFIAAFGAAMTIGNIPILIAVVIGASKNPDMLDSNPENLADLTNFGLDPNFGLVLIVIPFIFGLVAFALLMKPINGRTFKSVINGGGAVRWGRVFFSFALWTILIAGYLFLYMKVDPDNFTINNISNSLIPLAIISLLLLPFQTSFEEFIFRGYLMQGFGVAFGNKWGPLIVTSVLFGLLHAFNPEIKEFGFLTMMPQYITFGLIFGLVTVLDNGIEIAVGAHAANNIFLSIFLTQKSSALRTVAVYEQQEVSPWLEYLFLVVVAIIFIMILHFVYKWKIRESFQLKK